MKGVVLYDDEHDIVSSMEKDLKGKYIPLNLIAPIIQRAALQAMRSSAK